MSRKNHNTVKGRYSGKLNRDKKEQDSFNAEDVMYLINEDAILFRAIKK